MSTVRAYVGVTDSRWHRFLAARPDLDEVNFWRPGGRHAFRQLKVGEPFLFKARYPENRLLGGGLFSGFAYLRIAEAWDFYGEGNGVPSLGLMLAAIGGYRQGHVDVNSEIGCVLLRDVRFFDPYEDIPAPHDFAKNIVQGKGYEVDALSVEHEVAQAVYRLIQPGVYRSEADDVPGLIFGDDRTARSRLGQQGFRAMVTASYRRRCAVTGDRIRPVLEAAHIRPVTSGGENRLDNGLLLRSDVHTLFDRGYLGLDRRNRLRVSRRLREEFDNGLEFYSREHTEISLPAEVRNHPGREFIEWHNDVVFLD